MKHIKSFDTYSLNEDKKFYNQSVLILTSDEQAKIKKLIPDATFEVDDTDPKEPRQLVWSDVADEDKLFQVITQVTQGEKEGDDEA
jgi:hypothetical protein